MSDARPLSVPAAEYHAIKALSAGFVWEFDAECPRKAWLASPWNEARRSVNATHFDIGTAAHLAILEPDTFEWGPSERHRFRAGRKMPGLSDEGHRRRLYGAAP